MIKKIALSVDWHRRLIKRTHLRAKQKCLEIVQSWIPESIIRKGIEQDIKRLKP